MRTVIDGRLLDLNKSGVERYIYELVKNLADKPDLCLLKRANCVLSKAIGGISAANSFSGFPKIDLFHRTSQAYSLNCLLELLIPERSILTVHDLISCKFPNYFPNNIQYENYIKFMEMSLVFCDRIIAISKHNKEDIIKTFSIPEDKIDIIYHGIDTEKFNSGNNPQKIKEFKKKFGIDYKYILYLGTDYPHKNLKNLLKAFSQVLSNDATKDYRLIWVGNNHYCRGTNYLKNELGAVKDRVKFFGYVDDKNISALYGGAEMFVYPSLYEGFGLPILEAFACETPVVCSNVTSLPEVAGDAALMVDAADDNNIVKAIIDIAGNDKLRKQLIEKGKERVKLFTWEKCAKETYDVYKKTIDMPVYYKNKDDKYLKYIFKNELKGKSTVNQNKISCHVAYLSILFKAFISSLITFGLKMTAKKIRSFIKWKFKI